MNTVSLPDGTVYIKYSTAAHLLTTAMCPGRDQYRDVYVSVDRKLSRAVELGDLMARDPLTHRRHSYPVGNALREADLLVEDLKYYVAGHELPTIEISANAVDLS